MEEGVVVPVGGQFLLTWESREGRALESIIDTIVKGIEAVTNSTSRPQVFQGALSSPWRPKRILYQREGAPEDLKIEWLYGDWGTDHAAARLAGLLKSPTVLALTDSKRPSSARARHQLDAMPAVDATGAPPAPPDNTASSLPLIRRDESEPSPVLPKSGRSTSSTLESCEIASPSIGLSRNPEDPTQIQSPHTEEPTSTMDVPRMRRPKTKAPAKPSLDTIVTSAGSDTKHSQKAPGSAGVGKGGLMGKETSTAANTNRLLKGPAKAGTPSEQHATTDSIATTSLPCIKSLTSPRRSQSADGRSQPSQSTAPVLHNTLGLTHVADEKAQDALAAEPEDITFSHAASMSTPAPPSRASSINVEDSRKSGASHMRAASVMSLGGASQGVQRASLPPLSIGAPPLGMNPRSARASESPAAQSVPGSAVSTGGGMFAKAADALARRSPNIGSGLPGLGGLEPRERAVSAVPSRRMGTRSTTAGSSGKRGLGDDAEAVERPPGSPSKRACSKAIPENETE
ncbi:hypothetical protein FRC11_000309 [Ceratobasidium sp. 423]|nr:hypothetical protein FRC11_000309 [Ceratobasidium sp. 423]